MPNRVPVSQPCPNRVPDTPPRHRVPVSSPLREGHGHGHGHTDNNSANRVPAREAALENGRTGTASELDAMLADIARAVERARTFQCEHGLVNVSTRKLPSAILHNLNRWRERTTSPPNDDLH